MTAPNPNVVSARAKPFLKWVGGKQQLLTQFENYFPLTFKRYFEIFVGGGAVFFHLWNTGRLPPETFLFDHNQELTNAFLVVRDRVDELIALLSTHQVSHCPAHYYQIRALDRQAMDLDPVARAARTIYLNRTCYNGLYRVNRHGQFNVPIGRYQNPQILYEAVLRAASAALQTACIATKDFREIVDLARPGDFFYFDPPYDPVSQTASFTSYTATSFGAESQRALAAVFAQLTDRGCLCMLSNSHTPFMLELYRDFRVEVVQAKRAVNSKGNGRGSVPEILVLNY